MTDLNKSMAQSRAMAGLRHEAIASVLRSRIMEGQWNPQDRLPSFDMLALEFNVSNITIRQALSALESDGLVKRRQGVGTFVADIEVPQPNLMRLATIWGPIVETSQAVELQVLETTRHEQPVLLGRNTGTTTSASGYWYLRRLQLDDGKPFAILQAEVDWSVYQRAAQAFETERAILGILDKMPGLKVASAHQYLSIQVADIEEARLLDVALGSPVGKIKRVVLDHNEVAIAMITITYPGPLVRVEMSIS